MRGKSLKMYILNLVEIRWKLRILWRKFKKKRFDPKIEFEVEIQNSASTRSPPCRSRCFMPNFRLLRFQSSEISANKQTNKQTDRHTDNAFYMYRYIRIIYIYIWPILLKESWNLSCRKYFFFNLYLLNYRLFKESQIIKDVWNLTYFNKIKCTLDKFASYLCITNYHQIIPKISLLTACCFCLLYVSQYKVESD